MKVVIALIVFLTVFFILRFAHLRFTAPIREAERDRLEKILRAISQSSNFPGRPARFLFDALGPEDSWGSMDFGQVVHYWQIGQIVICAHTRNELCESFEVYPCTRSN